MPKLEEGLKLALSDRDKYISLLEQLKTYKQNLHEKIEKKLEEDRMLKVILDISYMGCDQCSTIIEAIINVYRLVVAIPQDIC